MKFDCYPNRGCGFDDDCGIEETCVNERLNPRGYRCLGKRLRETLCENFRQVLPHFYISTFMGGCTQLACDEFCHN